MNLSTKNILMIEGRTKNNGVAYFKPFNCMLINFKYRRDGNLLCRMEAYR